MIDLNLICVGALYRCISGESFVHIQKSYKIDPYESPNTTKQSFMMMKRNLFHC